MLTLHPPLREHSETVSKLQRSIAAMADCYADSSATIRDTGPPGERLTALAEEHAELSKEFTAALDGDRGAV